MMLDDRGVQALGKVSEERKLARARRARTSLCAPSLGGESFGMVLTEAFAAATPVVASDIPGYRDVLRDGVDGLLVPAGDALALARGAAALALDRAQRARDGRGRPRARRALRVAARRGRGARHLRAGDRASPRPPTRMRAASPCALRARARRTCCRAIPAAAAPR